MSGAIDEEGRRCIAAALGENARMQRRDEAIGGSVANQRSALDVADFSYSCKTTSRRAPLSSFSNANSHLRNRSKRQYRSFIA